MERPSSAGRLMPNRPLRTYSKRCSSNDPVEPPTKRLRTGDSPGGNTPSPLSKTASLTRQETRRLPRLPTTYGTENVPRSVSASSSSTYSTAAPQSIDRGRRLESISKTSSTVANALGRQDTKPLPQPSTQPSTQPVVNNMPKKGSILNYYKVTSPSSSFTSTSTCSQPVKTPTPVPTSTPATASPENKLRRRKPRRLTTRPISRPKTQAANTEEEECDLESTPEQALLTPNSEAGLFEDTSSMRLNRQESDEQKGTETGKRGAIKRQKSKQAAVQTTLSLSVNEKAFVECKDCNMLYNPFHEKDAKYHARRHAAIMKANFSQ